MIHKQHDTSPVLTGFFPNPSAIRAGEDYHLVKSSFQWFSSIVFTGTVVGIYAHNGGTGATISADFDWFNYEPQA